MKRTGFVEVEAEAEVEGEESFYPELVEGSKDDGEILKSGQKAFI